MYWFSRLSRYMLALDEPYRDPITRGRIRSPCQFADRLFRCFDSLASFSQSLIMSMVACRWPRSFLAGSRRGLIFLRLEHGLETRCRFATRYWRDLGWITGQDSGSLSLPCSSDRPDRQRRLGQRSQDHSFQPGPQIIVLSSQYGPTMSQAPPVMTSQSEQTAAKPRSCVVCRRRKVKCDKGSPCSNCRQANIACVLPSTDRPPRWARRLERFGSNIDAAFNTPNPPVMERVRHLENLVKKLRLQLEEARATNVLSSNGTPGTRTPGRSSHGHQSQESPTKTTADSIQKPFGRLVLEDANKSRYVSSGFWSQVNDEVGGSSISIDLLIDCTPA